ncbi:hypothetical protein HALDL1_10550 [Halobacterium sp. DL1]|nr:hypothetical protein HALDL1_10550 [Halobacterium sp. DL1]
MASQLLRVSPVSLVALAVGSLCVVVGAATVFVPTRVEAALRRVFPGIGGNDQQWRAAGLVSAGIGLLLITSV